MKDPLVTLAPLFGGGEDAPQKVEQYCEWLTSSPSVLAALVDVHKIEHEDDLSDLVREDPEMSAKVVAIAQEYALYEMQLCGVPVAECHKEWQDGFD
jgi:hypothetical protein